MPLTKRAFLYITRKKGKSILFLAVLFTIAALVLTGFAVGNASERAAASLRETLGGYFKIEENLTGQRVTDALVGEIAAFDGIKGYNGMDILYLNVEDGLVLTPGRFTSDGDEKAQMARFLSNTDSSLHEYFGVFRYESVRAYGGKAYRSGRRAEGSGVRNVRGNKRPFGGRFVHRGNYGEYGGDRNGRGGAVFSL